MTAPLCSVIIPSYNHEEFVLAALRSVVDQTYRNLEIIVIDDGSTDRSVERLREIRDDRVVIHVQENCGAHAAINKGFGMARGEYLAILNSDDLYHEERIERSISHLAPRGEAAFLSTWIHIIDRSGTIKGMKKGWHNYEPWVIARPEKSFQGTDDPILNLLMWNYVATTSNFVMHRSVYEGLGEMRNLRFVHDWDYLLRAVNNVPFVLLEEPLLSYRIHGRNTITSDRKRMLFEICWVLAAHIGSYEGTRLFCRPQREGLIQDLEMLYESINLQGNDKLFWVLRSCFNSLEKSGVTNPEEVVLADSGLQERLISLITDRKPAPASFVRRCRAALRGLFPHD